MATVTVPKTFKVGDTVGLHIVFEVVRILHDGSYDICNANGDCLRVQPNQILLLNFNNDEMKDMQKAVIATANKLMKAQGQVTTLEIKSDLILNQPQFYWKQSFVSTTMDAYHQAGKVTFTDNGSYRTYRPASNTGMTSVTPGKVLVATPKKAAKTTPKIVGKRISRTKALSLMANNKGHFFTATFIKANGDERTINCQFMKDQKSAAAGCIMVREAQKMKDGVNPIRQINIGTLKALKIKGEALKVY